MDEFMTTVDVGRLAGVGPTAVKRWADEGFLSCARTAGGHRRFLRKDVERFLREQRGGPAPGDSLVDLLLHTDGLGVEARLLGERARVGSWLGVADSLGGVLAEIGLRWRAGTITVIQEHVASARFSRALARLAEAIPVAPGAPRCLLACAEGDDHALGLSLVEITLREAGWTTLWAGIRTPAVDLADVAALGEVDMVVVSASGASADREVLRRELDVLAPACSEAGVALALGGQGAWPDAPAPARRFRSLAPFVAWAHRIAGGEIDPGPASP